MKHCLLPLLLAVSTLSAQTPPGGVFFDASGIPAFRQRFSTPLFANLRDSLKAVDRTAERRFLRSEVRLNDHLYDISRVGNRAMDMAFLYLFTGDEDAAALAMEYVETLMRFPRWDYFLDGGTDVIGLQRAPNSAVAVSLTIECLGDRIPTADRERWLTVMAERGIEPCFRSTFGMRYPDKVRGWRIDTASTYLVHRPADRGLNLSRWPEILNTINLKAVPASALAMSALTYRKYRGDTDDTRRWLEQAVFSITTFRDIFTSDGSYGEGVSYANYTMLHILQAADALRRSGIVDLTELLNWQGYLTYLLEMTQPTAVERPAIINFCDAEGGSFASAPFWIASHCRDGLAQWFGENLTAWRDPWSVLWFDSTVTPVAPGRATALWKSDLDWIVGRTGYGPQDLVVAMRSGPPQNHEHADRNSMVMKCFGEKLVTDPMRPPYNFADPAWRMRLTEGHSALLIDGKGHGYVDGREGTNSSKAEAKIVRWGEREGYVYWTSDATQAYGLTVPDVRSVTRSVVLLDHVPAVVVVDKVIKSTEPSRIQARFFGYNNDGKGSVEATEQGFLTRRPRAVLVGRAVGNTAVTFRSAILPIPQPQAGKHPFAEVGTATPEREAFLVTVLLAGRSTPGKVETVRKGNTYDIRISGEGGVGTVLIIDRGPIPAIEVH